MSFDPNNPRGTPPPPTGKPPSYIPPQPVNPGPSRLLIAGGAAIGVLIVGIVILFVLNMVAKPTTPAPTNSPAASAAPGTPAATVPGSPSASSVPSVGPSSAATNAPPTPGSSVVPPSAGTPAAQLLAHVPEAIRATCATSDGSGGVLVSASCTADGGTISVTYDQYGDATSMDAAYEDAFGKEQIDADSGSCEDHNTWPAEGAIQTSRMFRPVVAYAPTGQAHRRSIGRTIS